MAGHGGEDEPIDGAGRVIGIVVAVEEGVSQGGEDVGMVSYVGSFGEEEEEVFAGGGGDGELGRGHLEKVNKGQKDTGRDGKG